MALVAYYDGSGKSDRPSITLTGVAASEELWAAFEPLWVKQLDHNQVLDRDFHMADLMSSNGEFDGWKEPQRRALLKDLFNVFGQFRNYGMSAYSCTIFFAAHTAAKAQLPSLREPEAICVDYCVGGLQLTAEHLASDPRPILLYFDRHERFMHTVNRVWERYRKNKKGWPRQVRDIIAADRSEYYPIQAADMLAWIINRCCQDAAERGEAQQRGGWRFDKPLGRYSYLGLSARILVHHYIQCYDDGIQIIDRYPNG